MFTRAKSKIEEARTILDQLAQADNTPLFRTLFNSFLNSARAITNALQKEGKDIHGFKEWYGAKQEEMRSDELLRFIHEARAEDFHEGKHRLQFPSMHIQHFSSDKAGPRPSPNAIMVIGAEGPFWIVDKGTPKERRIPIKQGGEWVITVSIANAPTKHAGKTLERNDPLTTCQVALDYLSELVHEATTRFAS